MNFDSNVLQVAIEDIIPNRFQPRLAFEDGALTDLANSIKQHGIIQPLVLRKIGDKYEIIAGERRYKAATMAGLSSVPAVISQIDDQKSAEVAVVENVQRKDLTAIEEAKSYKALLDQGFMSQEQLAKRMGLSQSAISNKLRLLTLAPEVQEAILENKISERHARALLMIKEPETQVKWLNKIIDERLTVRSLDEELRKEYKDSAMNTNIDIEQIKQNATDIPAAQSAAPVESSPFTMGPIDLGQKQTNKFFNNLEDQAVNMQMTEAINPLLQTNESSNTPNYGFSVASVDAPAETKEEIVEPVEEEPEVQEISNEEVSRIDTFTPQEQINVMDEPEQIDSLDSLDVLPTTEDTEETLSAKDKIENLAYELQDEGYNIELFENESDNQTIYTIVIKETEN